MRRGRGGEGENKTTTRVGGASRSKTGGVIGSVDARKVTREEGVERVGSGNEEEVAVDRLQQSVRRWKKAEESIQGEAEWAGKVRPPVANAKRESSRKSERCPRTTTNSLTCTRPTTTAAQPPHSPPKREPQHPLNSSLPSRFSRRAHSSSAATSSSQREGRASASYSASRRVALDHACTTQLS